MIKRLSSAALLAVLLVALPMPAQAVTSLPPGAAGLQSALARYAAIGGHTMSVGVYDERTGRNYRFRPAATYDNASIVKVNILETVLWRAQNEHRWLTAWEQQQAVPMIRNSDNDAATRLWNHVGGSRGVAAYDRAVGLTSTRFDPQGRWGLTTSTVGDELVLLRAVGNGRGPLNARSRQYVRSQMSAVTPWQRWGVSAGPSGGVELKNGWLPRSTHGWRVNSIGRIRNAGRDYTIAVLTTDNRSMAEGVATIEGASRIVFRALAPR